MIEVLLWGTMLMLGTNGYGAAATSQELEDVGVGSAGSAGAACAGQHYCKQLVAVLPAMDMSAASSSATYDGQWCYQRRLAVLPTKISGATYGGQWCY
jgi:hypothetical protein